VKMAIKKVRHAIWILRQEGLLSLVIITLISIQRKQRRNSVRFKQRVQLAVKYPDALAADLARSLPAWSGTSSKHLTFNWIMPPPGKGSGGHMTIFRFIETLEKHGHTCRIYLYTVSEHGPISGVRASMGDSFPALNASMEWLPVSNEMAPADGVFATSWETAYASFNAPLSARRFYFVQDFEPFFYPVGSQSILAENSYRFGFFGITAGGWLSERLAKNYGMKTAHFDFGADKSVYGLRNTQPRKEIALYVRPFTDRRGFELGILAMDLFHRQHPDYVINLVGWDTSDYDLPFPYVNHKTLEVHQLSKLYDRCAAALVISLTNMSLLPLELLASGTIPVVNDGANNRLVSDSKFIAYAQSDPASLARKLGEVVGRHDLVDYSKRASASVEGNNWADSGQVFLEIVETETRKRG
jgi:glycosyltransferase involved in cell wall biosynthesis